MCGPARRGKGASAKYHAFLYANRMNPGFNESLQPEIRVSGGEVTLRFDEQSYTST